MENVVLCPVHGEKLEIRPKIIVFLGMHYNSLEGRCPKCRMVYLDQKIKGIARFTYEGANYQYLPELESWRIEQEQKKEEERKKAEVKRKMKENYPFLKSRGLKIRISPNKSKRCPEHGNKLSGLIGKLSDCDNNELITLDGCYCPQCNALYLNPDAKESVERYSHNAQLKLNIKFCGEEWEQVPRIGITGIQFPERTKQENKPKKDLEEKIKQLNKELEREKIERKQEEAAREKWKAEQIKQKFEEQHFRNFPFLRTGEIRIETVREKSNYCPVHQELLGVMNCKLKETGRNLDFQFVGHYCPKCNCVYQKKKIENKLAIYIKTGVGHADYTLTPMGNEWKNAHPIKVSELKLIDKKLLVTERKRPKDNTEKSEIPEKERKSTPKVDETLFKLSAYQKFDREIVEILATVNGTEKYIRVLTSVKKDDERKCVANEILERESVSLGRELLGRIAHGQLDEFISKIGKIKVNNYKVWPGQEYHLDGFTKFSNPDKIQDITIMSQKNLDRDSEEYEMVTALVYCANREEPVYIDVYYSQRQNRYFINDESYRLYRVRYGLPYVHLVPGQYDGNMDYGNLRQCSELNLYGYTVAKAADMTSGERQRLLQQLMDNGLMSKHKIVNHLEWLIHRQSGRISMEDACDCWREDLKFVNSYKIQNQRKIRGQFVYGNAALKH